MSETKASEVFSPVEKIIIAAQPGWKTQDMIPIIAWLIRSDGKVYPITVHGVIGNRSLGIRTPERNWLIIGERDTKNSAKRKRGNRRKRDIFNGIERASKAERPGYFEG